MTEYKFHKPPEPVGYWVLYDLNNPSFYFPMYTKPTEQQIKNTEDLLGWKWKDAK